MSSFYIQAIPGVNYKTIFENGETGEVWNPTLGTPDFEPWDPAHVAQYQITSTVDARGEVTGTIPPGIPDLAELVAKAVIIAGANLATSDFPPAAGYSGRFTSGNWVRNPEPTSGGGTGTGNGDVAVDHNYGGANALQIVGDDDLPVDNAMIRAYVDSEFQIGNIDPQPPSTTTGSEGEWIAPLMLDPLTDPDDRYRLIVYNPATKKSKAFLINVEAP